MSLPLIKVSILSDFTDSSECCGNPFSMKSLKNLYISLTEIMAYITS